MENNKNFSQKIVEQIRLGKIKSRPKIYFILQTLLLLFIIGVSVAGAVFLASFVAFGFSLKGSLFLLLALAFAVLIFFLLAFLFSEKLTFFYKRPFIFGFLILTFLIFILSSIVFKSSFHQKVLNYANKNNVPILSPMYKCGCGCGCSKQASCSCLKETETNKACLH